MFADGSGLIEIYQLANFYLATANKGETIKESQNPPRYNKGPWTVRDEKRTHRASIDTFRYVAEECVPIDRENRENRSNELRSAKSKYKIDRLVGSRTFEQR